MSEFLALGFGLIPAILFSFGTNLGFPQQMIAVAGMSLIGTLLGALFFSPTDPEKLKLFVEKIQPSGFWGEYGQGQKVSGTFLYVSIILFVVSTFFVGQGVLNGNYDAQFMLALFLVMILGGPKIFNMK